MIEKRQFNGEEVFQITIHNLDFLLDCQMLQTAHEFENMLTSTFQHELNTPLNTIVTQTRMWLDKKLDMLNKSGRSSRKDRNLTELRECLRQIWCQGKSL